MSEPQVKAPSLRIVVHNGTGLLRVNPGNYRNRVTSVQTSVVWDQSIAAS